MKTIPFSERIKEYMREYDLRQEDVANRIGVSKMAVSNYCTGKSTPILGDVPKIAEKMGVSLTWLLGNPKASMHNHDDDSNDQELTEVIKEKMADQETMDKAPREEINGSMYPVYTREQLDKRLDMIGKAFDMFNEGKLTEEMFKLIVNSLR